MFGKAKFKVFEGQNAVAFLQKNVTQLQQKCLIGSIFGQNIFVKFCLVETPSTLLIRKTMQCSLSKNYVYINF